MQVPIKGRIFLVGCPRSGSTLLQSLLAAHPQVASFPESHFFRALVANRSSWQRKLRLASGRARPRFNEFLHEIDHDEMQNFLPKTAIFIPQYVQTFIRVLDTLTAQQSKSFWLEKTPGHVRHIDCIEKWVAAPRFIHILRDGTDVVASLYEVTHQHPKAWHGAWDIDRCVRQWIQDVQLSSCHLHKPHHTLVRYNQFVNDPQRVLEELCEFVGIAFDKTALQQRRVAAKQVILKSEPWKVSVGGAIYNTKGAKFYKLFDEGQRQYILEQLAMVDTNNLGVRQSGMEDGNKNS